MRTASYALAVLAASWLLPWAAGRFGAAAERRRGGFVRNYRGIDVPLGLGWAWVGWAIPVTALAVAWNRAGLLPGVLVLGAAGLGWLDDRHGADGPKGFRGHLSALGEGRVTTGLLKLAGIGALSLAAAWVVPRHGASGAWAVLVWLASAAVVALTVNLVNLLDLRPGRALKGYILLAVPAAAVAGGLEGAAFLVPLVLGPALACFPADLRERAMLGDMGANAAGAAAGWLLASVLVTRPLALGIVAALLLALNLASERVSFSAVIERTPVLRWVDRLGRLCDVRGEEQATDGETGT